ncbi:hypothetical protein INT47_009733, partial [Mucor saturninus]
MLVVVKNGGSNDTHKPRVQTSAENFPIDLTYRALTKYVKKSRMTEVFQDYKTSMTTLDDLDSLVVITRGLDGLSEVDQARHNERLVRRRAATIQRNRNTANSTTNASNESESSGSDSQEEASRFPTDSSSEEDSDFSYSDYPVGGLSPQGLHQNQPVTFPFFVKMFVIILFY